MPARTALTRTGASGSPTTRAVSQAQSIQASGPTNQPQWVKNPCEKTSASSTESTATATTCTTATRQRIAESTLPILSGDRYWRAKTTWTLAVTVEDPGFVGGAGAASAPFWVAWG